MTKIPDTIQLAAAESTISGAKIAGTAYSGNAVNLGWGLPVTIDLAGLALASQLPLIFNHQYSPGYRLGMTQASNNGNSITFTGEIDTSTEMGKGIASSGRKWPWQASIGADVQEVQCLKSDETAEVNGATAHGPAYIVRKSLLREISVVVLGADPDTHIQIAASFHAAQPNQQETPMADNQTKTPSAQAAEPAADQNTQAEPAPAPAVQAAAQPQTPDVAARIADLEARLARAEAQASRPIPNLTLSHNDDISPMDLVRAAVNSAAGIAPEATGLSPRTIEAAAKKYPSGLGLKHAVLLAAKANGCTADYIDASNWYEILPYAGGAKAGYSGLSVSGILSNIANKSIKKGFSYVEQAWRQIADIQSVSDFKTITSYRLTTEGEFDEVGPTGEIKQGTLSEDSWNNQAKTYGLLYALTRQDIINDDMGALTSRAFQFGRKAGLKVNKVFWAAFLANTSSFFGSGNNNILSSASALAVDTLGALLNKFDGRLDKNGDPIGGQPTILLVPSTLRLTAEGICKDQYVTTTGSNSKTITTSNPHAGKYRPVVSAYLENANISGYSAADYYLLDDPAALAAMQVVFLNGRQEPIVEESSAEFSSLGIQWRAYFDFGAALADPLAGVKADVA